MYKIISILIASSFALLAHAEELVTVPELEGGFTASIGTFYARPSTQSQNLRMPSSDLDNNANNQFGTEASIGYIFDNTANGVEFSNRRMQ